MSIFKKVILVRYVLYVKVKKTFFSHIQYVSINILNVIEFLDQKIFGKKQKSLNIQREANFSFYFLCLVNCVFLHFAPFRRYVGKYAWKYANIIEHIYWRTTSPLFNMQLTCKCRRIFASEHIINN